MPGASGPPVGHCLVLAATEAEAVDVVDSLEAGRSVPLGPWTLRAGRIGDRPISVLVHGVGQTNTAAALALALFVVSPACVISVGVGGAYPETGLEPGDLAVSSVEIYGDLGVEGDDPDRGLRTIGIPSLERGQAPLYNHFAVDPDLAAALYEAAADAGHAARGPFVTVSTVTASVERATRLRRAHEGVCENMEGAAAAHVARAWGVPYGEVRGISNPVGPRHRDAWRLHEAAAVAQRALLGALAGPRLAPRYTDSASRA